MTVVTAKATQMLGAAASAITEPPKATPDTAISHLARALSSRLASGIDTATAPMADAMLNRPIHVLPSSSAKPNTSLTIAGMKAT